VYPTNNKEVQVQYTFTHTYMHTYLRPRNVVFLFLVLQVT